MTDTRRHFVLPPSKSILLSDDLLAFRDRVQLFLDVTGIPPEDVTLTPVVAIPVPMTAAVDGVRKRPRVDPEALWFPLLWLPLHVGLRMWVQETEHGPRRVETDEEWAVRVISAATDGGLFDPDTGTWLDALSTVGLDIDDPRVRDRAERWLAGNADHDFDRIDLSPRFAHVKPLDGHDFRDIHRLTQRQWVFTASHLSTATEHLLAAEHLTPAQLDQAGEAWLYLALVGFSGDPSLPLTPSVQGEIREILTDQQAGEMTGKQSLRLLDDIAMQMLDVYGSSPRAYL